MATREEAEVIARGSAKIGRVGRREYVIEPSGPCLVVMTIARLDKFNANESLADFGVAGTVGLIDCIDRYITADNTNAATMTVCPIAMSTRVKVTSPSEYAYRLSKRRAGANIGSRSNISTRVTRETW